MTNTAATASSGKPRARLSEIVLATFVVAVGALGLVSPPTLPDSPNSAVSAVILSLACSAAIGAGVMTPFKKKASGALWAMVLMSFVWVASLVNSVL